MPDPALKEAFDCRQSGVSVSEGFVDDVGPPINLRSLF